MNVVDAGIGVDRRHYYYAVSSEAERSDAHAIEAIGQRLAQSFGSHAEYDRLDCSLLGTQSASDGVDRMEPLVAVLSLAMGYSSGKDLDTDLAICVPDRAMFEALLGALAEFTSTSPALTPDDSLDEVNWAVYEPEQLKRMNVSYKLGAIPSRPLDTDLPTVPPEVAQIRDYLKAYLANRARRTEEGRRKYSQVNLELNSIQRVIRRSGAPLASLSATLMAKVGRNFDQVEQLTWGPHHLPREIREAVRTVDSIARNAVLSHLEKAKEEPETTAREAPAFGPQPELPPVVRVTPDDSAARTEGHLVYARRGSRIFVQRTEAPWTLDVDAFTISSDMRLGLGGGLATAFGHAHGAAALEMVKDRASHDRYPKRFSAESPRLVRLDSLPSYQRGAKLVFIATADERSAQPRVFNSGAAARAIVRHASQIGLRRVAICLLGSGSGRLSSVEVFKTMFTAISTELSAGPPLTVVLTTLSPEVMAIAVTLVEEPTFLQHELGHTESCLRLDDYADALSTLFRNATSDILFGIFGHWGRGKTRLASEVTRRLATEPLASVLRQWLDGGVGWRTLMAALVSRAGSMVDRLRGRGPLRYAIVDFSAWKFPTTPEIWANLYQCFSQVALGRDWLPLPEPVARVVRTNLARRGILPLCLTLCAFATAIAPLWGWVKLFTGPIPAIFGILGAIRILIIYYDTKHLKPLVGNYLRAAAHTKSLGLQAAIGEDLEALLRGWIPKPRRKKPPVDVERRSRESWRPRPLVGFWGWIALGLSVTCLGYSLYRGFTGERWLPIDAPAGLEIELSWEPSRQLKWAIVLGSFLAVGMATAFLGLWGRGVDRVLLVVDDIDRCHPLEMVKIIESLKLFLEDREIAARVQVLMLVDDQVLRRAILKKYSLAVAAHGGGPPAREAVVQECLEKIFVAHLRLQPLGPDEFRDVLTAFVRQESEDPGVDEPQAGDVAQRPGTENGTTDPEPLVSVAGGHAPSLLDVPTPAPRPVPADALGVQVRAETIPTPAPELTAAPEPGSAPVLGSAPELGVAPQLAPGPPAAPRIQGRATTTRSGPRPAPSMELPERRDRRFRAEEFRALTSETVQEILRARGNAGPRVAQSFLLKYQLARTLLEKRLGPLDTSGVSRAILAQEIARCCANEPSSIPSFVTDAARESLLAVVNELRWSHWNRPTTDLAAEMLEPSDESPDEVPRRHPPRQGSDR